MVCKSAKTSICATPPLFLAIALAELSPVSCLRTYCRRFRVAISRSGWSPRLPCFRRHRRPDSVPLLRPLCFSLTTFSFFFWCLLFFFFDVSGDVGCTILLRVIVKCDNARRHANYALLTSSELPTPPIELTIINYPPRHPPTVAGCISKREMSQDRA